MDRKSATIIVYGSYGFTGKLIVQECKAQELNVILAGRNGDALQQQSVETGYQFEQVDTSDSAALRRLLKKGIVVIHCAGPFQFTARAMVEACIETKTHYTDITGEHQVFEMLAGYYEKGKNAGITILPGTGFDVVPSDCLALHLKKRLPTATHLQLAFTMSKGGLSRGTAKTSVEGLGYGSLIRRNDKLIPVSLGKMVLNIDFGPFKRKALNIPWGDISTAWRSTGIPNIEVYMGARDRMIFFAKLSQYINWLLRQGWIKKYLQQKIDNKPAGPSKESREEGKSFLWGKVWDETDKQCVSRIETISAYTLTAKTSVLIAKKILKGNFKAGYQTPAMAYGEDLILEVERTKRIVVRPL